MWCGMSISHNDWEKDHRTKNEVFPLYISAVNVTKSAENCEFGHIMENCIFCAVDEVK